MKQGGENREGEPEQVPAESARQWVRAPLLLAGLLVQREIVYFYFLQPNQCLEGSKPLSGEERDHLYPP